MKTKSVMFPCGKLKLEGSCCYPDGKSKFPAVVLCHPHPMYGGSMDNNVILALASTLVKKSMIAFMFNFRSVGKSQGSFSGIDEQEDVAAAINWLVSQHEVDTTRIGLAGYSFGASVALPEACSDPRVRALALISPALIDQPKITQLKSCKIPKLIISGSADKVISDEQLKLMEQEADYPKRFEIVTGADHFWVSHETALANRVTTFFSILFTPDGG